MTKKVRPLGKRSRKAPLEKIAGYGFYQVRKLDLSSLTSAVWKWFENKARQLSVLNLFIVMFYIIIPIN
jgi:hypothetical protein